MHALSSLEKYKQMKKKRRPNDHPHPSIGLVGYSEISKRTIGLLPDFLELLTYLLTLITRTRFGGVRGPLSFPSFLQREPFPFFHPLNSLPHPPAILRRVTDANQMYTSEWSLAKVSQVRVQLSTLNLGPI